GAAPAVGADVAAEVVVVGHEVPGVAPVAGGGAHEVVEAGGLQVGGDQTGPGEDLAPQGPMQPIGLGHHQGQLALFEIGEVVSGRRVEGGRGGHGIEVHGGHRSVLVTADSVKPPLPGAGDDRHLDAAGACALGEPGYVPVRVRAVEKVQLVLD